MRPLMDTGGLLALVKALRAIGPRPTHWPRTSSAACTRVGVYDQGAIPRPPPSATPSVPAIPRAATTPGHLERTDPPFGRKRADHRTAELGLEAVPDARMIVFPLSRPVALNAATASS